MQKFQKLSRNEMKNVTGGLLPGGGGGGTASGCCAHNEDWSAYNCKFLTAEAAQLSASAHTVATGERSFYCCDCPARA